MAVAFMAVGAWWALTHPEATQGVRVAAIPFAQTLYCVGWVLLLLRFYVSMDWIARVRLLERLVSAVNARAVTIYLWANVGIGVAAWTIDRIWPEHLPWSSEVVGGLVLLSLVSVFLMVAVLGLGWVEDWPPDARPRSCPGSVRHPATPHGPARRHGPARQHGPAARRAPDILPVRRRRTRLVP